MTHKLKLGKKWGDHPKGRVIDCDAQRYAQLQEDGYEDKKRERTAKAKKEGD